MHKKTLIHLLFTLTCISLHWQVAVGNTAYSQYRQSVDAQTTAKQLTALKIVRGEIDNLRNQRIDSMMLEHEILAVTSEHANRMNSMNRLRRFTEQNLRDSLEHRLEMIPAEVNSKEQRWITKEWLSEQIKSKYQGDIDAAIQSVLTISFDEAFETARSSAVCKQRQTVTLSIYPNPFDVEKIEHGKRDSVEALLRKKMSGSLVLLEENETWIKGEVNRVIEDALQQLRNQREYIKQSKAPGFFTENAIDRQLLEQLRQYIRKQNSGEGKKVYDVFQSVEHYEIPNRAKELMLQNFREFISGYNIPSNITERIKDHITRNLTEHKQIQQSFEKIKEALRSEVEKAIVRDYREVAGEGKDFQEKLEKVIASDPTLSQAVVNELNAGFSEPFQTVRKQIVQGQLAHFPTIMSKQWEPPEVNIINFKEKETKVALPELANILHVKGGEKVVELFLEETDDTLNQRIENLLNEGHRALDGQEAIVRDPALQDKMKEKLRREFETDRHYSELNRTKRFQQYGKRVIEQYKREVEKEWKNSRKDRVWPGELVQAYMNGKYLSLFNRTKEIISEIIKEILPDFPKPIPQVADNISGDSFKGKDGKEGDGGRSGGGGGGGGGGNDGGRTELEHNGCGVWRLIILFIIIAALSLLGGYHLGKRERI